MSLWVDLAAVVLYVVIWWHGWYVGRRAGFNEILEDFEQQDLEFEEIKRRADERRRDA